MAKGKLARGSRPANKARRAAYISSNKRDLNAKIRQARHKKRVAADTAKVEAGFKAHGFTRALRRLKEGTSKTPAWILVEAKIPELAHLNQQ